jgi:CheY-like chemotaxis protein
VTRGPAAATPLRVLIVDDNEDAAEMLSAALSAAGHETAVAGDGPAALALAATFRPGVALLDIGLPVMDGFELAQHFRTHDDPALRTVRLVAVTGYGQDHDRRRSASAGFDEHLVKPVDLDRLAAVIQQMAESS